MIDLLIAIALCCIRIGGVHNNALKDTAHIFMGYLGRRVYEDRRLGPWYFSDRVGLFAVLCVVEVGCALYYGLH